MSGELMPSQFRYSTTNNRDLVIGDPSQQSGANQYDPLYLVFQTGTVPGYSNNPYIGSFWNTTSSQWEFRMSANGTSFLTFPDMAADNTWAGTNVFNGNVTLGNNASNNIIINGTTTINSPITFSSTATFSSGTAAFNNVTVSGSLTVNGSSTSLNTTSLLVKDQNIELNVGGTTASAANGGLLLRGTSNIVAGYAQVSADSNSWQFLAPGRTGILTFTPSTYNTSFISNSLSGHVSYSMPNVSGLLLVATGTYTPGRILVSGTDSVIASSITSASLSYVDIGSSLTGLLAGKASLSGGNTFNSAQYINGTLSISSGGSTITTSGNVLAATNAFYIDAGPSYGLYLSGPGGIYFSNNGGSAINASIDSSGNIHATAYFGSGVGLSTQTIPLAAINASGSRNSSTYLRGDGVWTAVSTGGGGGLTSVSTAAANNGVITSWANPTTAPALTIGLGDITPTTITTGTGTFSNWLIANNGISVAGSTGIAIGSGSPATTSDTLYQLSSQLYWNGNIVYTSNTLDTSLASAQAIAALAAAPRWVITLPSLPDPMFPSGTAGQGPGAGCFVCIVSSKAMYQNQGNTWVPVGVDSAIFGQVTAASISAASVGATALAANIIMSSKIQVGYSQNGSNFATAGVQLDGTGTGTNYAPLKIGPQGMLIGPSGFKIDDITMRSLNLLDGTSSTDSTFTGWYKGNVNTSYNGGAPNVGCVWIQNTFCEWTNNTVTLMWNFKVKGTSSASANGNNDNIDALTHMDVEVYANYGTDNLRQAITVAIPSRNYYNRSDYSHDDNCARSNMTIKYRYGSDDSSTSSTSPGNWYTHAYCRIRVWNAYGPSAWRWYGSADIGVWNNGGISDPTGGAYPPGGGGGGGSAGGSCPAPWTLIDTVSGQLMAKDVKQGMLIHTEHEITGIYGDYEVESVELGINDIWTLVLEDGRSLDFAANHRFKTDFGYSQLKGLYPGQIIYGSNQGVVASTILKQANAEVIKITVKDAHTYETSGLLSHNIKTMN